MKENVFWREYKKKVGDSGNGGERMKQTRMWSVRGPAKQDGYLPTHKEFNLKADAEEYAAALFTVNDGLLSVEMYEYIKLERE